MNGIKIEKILDSNTKIDFLEEKILCYETDIPIQLGIGFYKNNDIKSIVTKEQFKKMEYKV